MLLQDSAIIERLIDDDPMRRIVITPLINPKEQIGPSSVDVRIGGSFKVPTTSRIGAIDPEDGDTVATYTTPVEIGHRDEFILHPGEFVLAGTLEYIRVPRDLACRIEGRSSWGRLGLLVHATASFVDPGYSGNLTLELYNAGRLRVKLRPGMRMAQLCFLELKDLPNAAYDQRPESKYDKSLSPEGSRISGDKRREDVPREGPVVRIRWTRSSLAWDSRAMTKELCRFLCRLPAQKGCAPVLAIRPEPGRSL